MKRIETFKKGPERTNWIEGTAQGSVKSIREREGEKEPPPCSQTFQTNVKELLTVPENLLKNKISILMMQTFQIILQDCKSSKAWMDCRPNILTAN